MPSRPGDPRNTRAHRQAATTLKAALQDGDPCCRCHQPLYRWQLTLHPHHPHGIDADHHTHPLATTTTPGPPDALAHRHCNRSHGATLGNHLRTHHPRPTPTPRPTPPHKLPIW